MDAVEQKIIDIIDAHHDEIIEFARDIYSHAELGYKEFNTSKKFVDFSKKLGLQVQEGLAITGDTGTLLLRTSFKSFTRSAEKISIMAFTGSGT